ncbi:MAG: hypothetical protein MUP81_03130 [Dehalococcoidia bacterium]|nr:hypothetical protein [Dehalococcoidia bacterium]
MAGAATVSIKVNVTGLGSDVEVTNSKTMTVPVEYQAGYTVLTTATATALQLFALVDHFDLDDIFGVYIKAEVGTVYITVDTAGTGTITATTADLLLNVGEACYLPININTAANLGLLVDGSAVTAAISWLILARVSA